jgi:hypothetical protein
MNRVLVGGGRRPCSLELVTLGFEVMVRSRLGMQSYSQSPIVAINVAPPSDASSASCWLL